MKNTVILLGLTLLSITILQNNTYKKEAKKQLLTEQNNRLGTINSSISLENMPIVIIKRD